MGAPGLRGQPGRMGFRGRPVIFFMLQLSAVQHMIDSFLP